MSQDSNVTTAGGEPLWEESTRILDYLRSRAAALHAPAICSRLRSAARELESTVAAVRESDSRLRPFPGKWTIAEVVDHLAQSQIRAADELRHLLAGRLPPAPPVYDALRSGASEWAPWAELVNGLRSADAELIAVLAAGPGEFSGADAPRARTVLVASRTGEDSRKVSQTFLANLGWKEYALVQRFHMLDHCTQIKNLQKAIAGG